MSTVLKPIIPVFGPVLRRGTSALWARPADWPAMPASQANYIDILAAVVNDDSNYVALSATVTGGYTVDWGDGNVENVASGVTAEHKYSYADTDLGALTAEGYKTAIIRIYPQAANNITAFDLGKKHSRANLSSYSNPWLDIQVNTPSCTSMTYRGGVEARIVERINIVAIGGVTSLNSTFYSCYALQSVTFPSGSLASITSLSSTFYACYALRSVTFPSGSLASVTSLSNTFYSCYALQSVTFPSGSLASVTTLSGTFQSCSSIKSVTFPSGSLASVTNLASVFINCFSLQSVTFPSGSLASVTTLANAFQNCYALQSVTFPSGSLASVTSLASTFLNCYSLQSITFPSGSLASVTDTTSTFTSCNNLARIVNCLIPITFTLSNSNLAGTEIDEIYTSLPTVTSKTITVTGNHGVPDSTPSIATGKGWTVA